MLVRIINNAKACADVTNLARPYGQIQFTKLTLEKNFGLQVNKPSIIIIFFGTM
jgi:hypothetical protein